MLRNPFTSEIFTTLWSKHFSKGKSIVHFEIFGGLKFIKHGRFPYFINAGENLTKGISYDLQDTGAADHRGKVFLIYDVPAYFPEVPVNASTGLACHRVKQYPGFLIDVAGYKDLAHFMQERFSKSSRYKLNKYKKRLEASFDIRYTMYCGEISRDTYDLVFTSFRELLEKRFDEKQITNNNLDPKEWDFYREVAYPMILEKQAGLFVVYDGQTPIAVTLNFFSDTILFDAITAFDTAYYKFHLGSVSIMALIDWCTGNSIEILDFSKGYFDYKTRWATREYSFDYHIYYDRGSFPARITAYFLQAFFRFKQYLRTHNINDKVHRLTYRLKNKRGKNETTREYQFSEVERENPGAEWIIIDADEVENHLPKSIIFDFLYLNDESYNNLKVYKIRTGDQTFLLYGTSKSVQVMLN